MPQPALTKLVTAVTCFSVFLLTWFGYTAIRAWQRSSSALAEQSTSERVDVFAKALSRDMQGVQHSVLLSADLAGFALDPSYDATNLVASAFARYPYPEFFFAWRSTHPSAETVFFSRKDRPPQWVSDEDSSNRFPVLLTRQSQIAETLLGRIEADATLARPFSVFEIGISDTRYQVVARLLYRDALREHVHAMFGFAVNLAWARQHYFPLLTDQLTRLAGAGGGLHLRMTGDRQRRPVQLATAHIATDERSFPMFFFDPLLVAVDQSNRLPHELLTVESVAADDPGLIATNRGANWMLSLGTLAAAAIVLGLALSLRAAQTSVRLTELRSDFVAAVSHELKTPIATIRAVGETLLSGRVEDSETRHDYARLVVQEAKRLTRSVENLLAFSRVTDVGDVYRFEPLSLHALVRDTLQEFSFKLADERFQVAVDIPAGLSDIVGDRGAIHLLLENLVDNAIRHAAQGRWIGVQTHETNQSIRLDVSDRGPGIAEDEVAKVTRKFYRGRNAASGGTGLGLAIVKRIITAHGGSLTIASTSGTGTTVSVSFRRWPTR